MMEMFKNHEQQSIAFNEAQRKAKNLKLQYLQVRNNGGDIGPIQSQLNRLIGETHFPQTTGISDELAKDRLDRWAQEDLGNPNNFSENSELGKLFASVKSKAETEARKGNESLNRIDVRFKTLMADAKSFLETAKNNGDLSIRNQARENLVRLVGQESADKLISGEITFNDTNIGGELGRLADEYDKKIDALQNEPLVRAERNAESTSETAKKGPGARFKEFIGGIFAEAGKLVPGGLKEKWNATEGSWWDKAKGMFKREKKEETRETSNEQERNAFQEFAFNSGRFTGEAGIKIRELLAKGLEGAKELKELLDTDPDARDQAIAIGVNILSNAFHLNPIGMALSPVVKGIVDYRAIGRAEEARNLDNYVRNRFQMGTNRENFQAVLMAEQAQQEIDSAKDLLDDLHKETEELQTAIRALEEQKTGLNDNDEIQQIEVRIAGLKGRLAANEYLQNDVKAFLENPQAYRDAQTEESNKKFSKHLAILGRFGRGMADIFSTYANVFKKFAIDAQGCGRDVHKFIEKSSKGEQNAEAALNAVDALAARLTPEKIMERSKTDKKALKNDLLEFRNLLSSLIDLGIIGDMIPRNIGHRQINGLLKKMGLGGLAGEEGLIRDPAFLAQLRDKVQGQAQIMAAELAKGPREAGDKAMKWDKINKGERELLEDIMAMSNRESWIVERSREMARNLTTADILAMFANSAVVYAGTHAGELTEGMKKIIDDFNHERSLSTSGQELRNVIDNHSVGNVSETGSTDTGASETNSPTSGGSANTETSSPTTSSSSGGESDVLSPTSNAPTENGTASPTSTPEVANVIKLDNETAVQYADTDGIIHIDRNTNVIGHLADGTTTTDGGAAFLITPDNPGGTWGGRLLADAANAGVQMDVRSETAFLYNYLLPLSREMGRNFTASELLQIDALGDQGLTWQQIAQQMFGRNVQ